MTVALTIVIMLGFGCITYVAHEARDRREARAWKAELAHDAALYATAPDVAPPGWHLTSDRFWLKTFTSDDGHWRIEPFATDPFGPPRGWVLIDARNEQGDAITRPGSFSEVLAYAKEQAK